MESPDKNLIDRVMAGTASRKEAREVAEWLSSTVEGQACLSEMINHDVHLIETGQADEPELSPVLSQKMLSEINRQIHQKSVKRMIFRVAAVLIPFVFIAALTFYTNSRFDLFGTSKYSEMYIPKGEKTRILFQDGSQAYLNADTKIRYPVKFGLIERKIHLEGEAYFKIATNSNRPFIIQVNNTKVKVLGTSFNVKAYKNDNFISVVLDKGKVTYITPRKDYNLLPGQQIVYDKGTGLCTISSLERSAEASLWVNNIIQFKDTPLPEVLKTLNRVFNIEFRLENPNAYKYTYTLTTESTSLEVIIKELEKITPVRFHIQNDNVILVTTN